MAGHRKQGKQEPDSCARHHQWQTTRFEEHRLTDQAASLLTLATISLQGIRPRSYGNSIGRSLAQAAKQAYISPYTRDLFDA